jgi:hypothetical protein
MKNKSSDVSLAFKAPAPSEQEISECAFNLYEQGNREHGHDVEHWHEASRLLARTPPCTASV